MRKPCFIDSNILIYSISNEFGKSQIARNVLLDNNIIISTQVLNEFCNVILRKKLMTPKQVGLAISAFVNDFTIIDIDSDLIIDALTIKNRHQYSYWDSLIIATALKSNADILYSEDMHHNHVIDNKLTIINPFL